MRKNSQENMRKKERNLYVITLMMKKRLFKKEDNKIKKGKV